MHPFYHALKISWEEKSEEGVHRKSKRSSCPKCLALELLHYWPWGCVLLVHDCLSAANNFVLSALVLSSAGTYVIFTTEGIARDFSFELFWHKSIVLCGKEVYSLLALGRIMWGRISTDFSIFLLQSSCWDLVFRYYFGCFVF